MWHEGKKEILTLENMETDVPLCNCSNTYWDDAWKPKSDIISNKTEYDLSKNSS